ncbi:ABC transporter permease [Lachnospiraceae bacterium C1.1]|nr:ABC transporter permease [Lachnospiraceae bacterium C1.1]
MFVENIKLALTALAANKMRTLLTMLGIIIGIASVIAIMTVGDAMNNSMLDSMGDMGINNVSVFISEKMQEDGSYSDRKMKDSDYFDVDFIESLKEKFKGKIEGVSLKQELGSVKVTDKKNYANINLKGVNRTAFKQTKAKIIAGRNLNSDDYVNGNSVVIVSDRYVNNIFDGDAEKALGQNVEVVLGSNYYSYVIVGVYEYQDRAGGFSAGGSQKDLETEAYIPIVKAMHQKRENQHFSDFDVVAASGQDPDELSMKLQEWINSSKYKDNDAYESYCYSMKADVEQMKGMVSMLQYAFMGVGAISLLVGGIGVMNIMIVSITERTREIGTRKALGATNGYIRLQFITEAVVVCAAGGIIGILLGMGLGAVITKVIHSHGMASPLGILCCVAFSMVFGVFFGYYPANRAAKLNPIEALRYE